MTHLKKRQIKKVRIGSENQKASRGELRTGACVENDHSVDGFSGVGSVGLQEASGLRLIDGLLSNLAVAANDLIGADEDGGFLNLRQQSGGLGASNQKDHFLGIIIADGCETAKKAWKGAKLRRSDGLQAKR